MISPATQANDNGGRLDASAESADLGAETPSMKDGGTTDAGDASAQDWAEAENSRPTLPDQTADGLDDMDEEIRHQAEDLPLDTTGRL